MFKQIDTNMAAMVLEVIIFLQSISAEKLGCLIPLNSYIKSPQAYHHFGVLYPEI